ncbi:MAG TPA: hypothetical protein VI874_04825 [Candidatus Norongarragalinales archaeon]|nr:hypothetical protein [Candidatus Norongarragalinales archaeon]
MVKAWLMAFGALIVLFIAYPLLTPSVSGLNQAQAREYVLEDLKPLMTGEGVEARFVRLEKNETRWEADVLLSRNAHSACPTLEKRYYTLFPIGFRSEFLVDTCTDAVDINYREQALISAAKKTNPGFRPYGCAFFGKEYQKPESKTYCSILDLFGLDGLSEDLPADTWLVQWDNGRFVALSKNGQVIKTR